ncbi:MAG: sugar phosphate isomerase/epimerase [Bacteroidota bacterium]
MRGWRSTDAGRRSFVRNGLLLTAGAWSLPTYTSLLRLPTVVPQCGIVLNTVAKNLARDRFGTLYELRRMGYGLVEVNLDKLPPEFYRDARRAKLLTPVGGTSLKRLLTEPDVVIREAHKRNCRYVTTYWPWQSGADNLSTEEVKQTAGYLNDIGRQLAAADLGFTWHNHNKVFASLGNGTAFDRLMAETDPRYVNLQLDVYWAARGGQDPTAIMLAHAGRVPLLHLKDINAEDKYDCVGAGRLDVAGILAARETAGTIYTMVEVDKTEEEFNCARTSLETIKVNLP